MKFRERMKTIILLIISLSVAAPIKSQSKNELDKYYSHRINATTDSILSESKFFLDTLFFDFDSTYNSIISEYDDFFRDSVYYEVKDSVNEAGMDSLNKMSASFKLKINSIYFLHRENFKIYFNSFESTVNENKKLYSQCLECEDNEDYTEQLDEYSDVLDSISGEFQEKMNERLDMIENALLDSADEYEVKISDYGSDLMDRQVTDDENVTAGTETKEIYGYEGIYSKFLVEADYYNHYTYRGRDNGIYQNAFSPVISYEHPSGFGVSSAFYFANNSPGIVDELDLTGYFSFDISDNISSTIGFSHYFFSDSNSNAKSALTNSISGGMDFEYPYFNFNPVLNCDFSGKNLEFSIFLLVSSPVEISGNFLNGIIGTEPSASAIFGEQNNAIVNKLKQRRGISGTVLKAGNTAGILDYELSLPVIYKNRYFTLQSYFTYIIPLNVVDNSSKNPFFSFSMEFIAPFYLK